MQCPSELELTRLLSSAASSDRHALLVHLDGCASCRRWVAEIAAVATQTEVDAPATIAPEPPLEPGQKLGRYEVLAVLGEGGMGIVYSAHDTQLDRKVALKRIRAEALGSSAEDLLREAQVMAKLSHPNVLVVHDVSVAERQLFIAMEYVDGETLRSWLRRQRRAWRESLALLLDAGAGLEAAHRAGVIHRDFKPDNILVDTQGRVRVSDFGLARSAPALPLGSATSPVSSVAGTPRYMAPEQLRGAVADARTDQYSFCVCIYEALEGRLPARDAPPQWSNAGVDLRLAAIQRLVARGLAEDPQARHADLSALLQALRRELSPRPLRRMVAAFAVVAALAVVLSIWGLERARRVGLCAGGAQEIAQVWGGPQREAVRAAFGRSHAPFAAFTLKQVESALDTVSSEWAAMHRDACEATRVRAEQTEELLTLRMACLESIREEMRARVHLFETAEPAVISSAAMTVSALTPVSRCAKLSSLLEQEPLPSDAIRRGHAETALRKAISARAEYDAAHHPAAVKLADEAVQEARSSEHAPTLAEALVTRCRLFKTSPEEQQERERLLLEAIWAAERGRAREWRARGWLELASIKSKALQGALALDAVAHARAIAASTTALEAMAPLLDLEEADALAKGERLEEALAAYHRAAERAPSLGPKAKLFEAHARTSIAVVYRRQGRFAEALDVQQQVLRVRREALGPDHPLLAGTLYNIALLYKEMERWPECAETAQRALTLYSAALGADSGRAADAQMLMADAFRRQGDVKKSRELLHQAVAIHEKASGPFSLDVGYALSVLGDLERADGKLEEAERVYQRLEAVWLKALPARHRLFSATEVGFGGIRSAQRKWADARTHFRKAVELVEKDPRDPILPTALRDLGEAQLALSDPGAVSTAERLLELMEKTESSPRQKANAQFFAARALWTKQRKRALALAQSARAGAEVKSREAIDAWLKPRLRKSLITAVGPP